jgi:uncharacterized membrane protein
MVATSLRFCQLLLIALLVGTMFGIWVGANPEALSAAAYVEQQQNAIRALNTLLPVMGGGAIVLTIALAMTAKQDLRARALLVLAVLLLAAAGLITRFANQPLNAIVMTWNPQALPPEWTLVRDTWWFWHILRTVSGIAALALVLLEALLPRDAAASR